MIASYRDMFRLLLPFAQKRLRKPPSALALTDLDASLVSAFLDDLEQSRGVIARTGLLALPRSIVLSVRRVSRARKLRTNSAGLVDSQQTIGSSVVGFLTWKKLRLCST
jgi:hypothetical protein